jgi:hypothetical protein
MMLLRRVETGGVRRPGILTEGNVARAICAYCAGTGRGRITDDGGNLAELYTSVAPFPPDFLTLAAIS